MMGTIETMGPILRNAREAKGLSLEAVSKTTKISVKVLGALEDEELSKLPSPIYTKAFVKAYAGFLGVAPQALEQYEKIARPAVAPALTVRPETPLTGATATRLRAGAQRSRTVAAVAIVGVAALAGIIVLIKTLFVSSPVPAGLPQGASLPKVAAPPVVLPGVLPKPIAAPKQEAKPVAPPPSPAPVIPRDGLYLEIVAVDKVWVRVKADNLLLFEGTLAKDGRETWKAQREFLIRLGSAGSVNIYLNDKILNQVGNKGEVKTVVINKDGIVKTR